VTPGVRVLILPGYQNSGPEHWQSLWQARHPEYRRVEQRDWEYPRREEWVGALHDAVKAAPAPVVFVAHSLGCHAVMQWAARHAHDVAGALLVAPPDVERPDALADVRDFGPIPLASLPFPSIVVASTNDPFAEFARARQWAAAWGSRLVSLGAAGHINAAAGYGPWPDGERLLAQLTG
jgi:serine hydrolase